MQNVTKHTLLIFWQHAKQHPWSLSGFTIGIAGAAAVEVYNPLIYKNFFNILSGSPNNTAGIFHWLVLYVALNAVAWFFWRLAAFSGSYFQNVSMAALLQTCYVYLQQHSYNYFNNNFAGSLVRKMHRFVSAFENVTSQVFWNIGQTALRLLLIILILSRENLTFALIMLGWTALYSVTTISFSRYKLKYDLRQSKADTEIASHISDTVTNNVNLKLFSGIKTEVGVFSRLTDQLVKARWKSWSLSESSDAVQALLMLGMEALILYLAVGRWQKGNFSIGDFVLIQSYLGQVFSRLWSLSRYVRDLFSGLADANEMTEVLLTPHEIEDSLDAQPINITNGAISFDRVAFAYPDGKRVFENFTLDIHPGEKVAFVGSSGGGKSTIIKLLFRFYDPTSGSIHVDGQDITGVTQETLRQQIALVPQDPILFHRSILENIRYAKPEASVEEAVEAAKRARCHEFIKQLPDAYDSLVGERGLKLSGGERQRIAIARAFLKNAPILVLDEATSALDSESERHIQDALRELMHDKTVIVIAHRLSTIMEMDRILVLQDGQVVEEGRHEELVSTEGFYHHLWEIQAGGFGN